MCDPLTASRPPCTIPARGAEGVYEPMDPEKPQPAKVTNRAMAARIGKSTRPCRAGADMPSRKMVNWRRMGESTFRYCGELVTCEQQKVISLCNGSYIYQNGIRITLEEFHSNFSLISNS